MVNYGSLSPSEREAFRRALFTRLIDGEGDAGDVYEYIPDVANETENGWFSEMDDL